MKNNESPRNSSAGDRERNRQRNPYYDSDRYYSQNRRLGEARAEKNINHDDEDQYDDFQSGKHENYKGDGYYGSNYGSINEWNTGRDYEGNAGYRESYDRLTTGQWPEVQEAAERRGFDLHQYELRQRGVHKGKGPKGWQRSDQRITDDVNDALTEDPYVDASDIEVSVEHGEVTLAGTVESRLIKRRAEDLAERVSGVKNVENRLRTRVSGSTVNIRNS